jgi:hypothetical protein
VKRIFFFAFFSSIMLGARVAQRNLLIQRWNRAISPDRVSVNAVLVSWAINLAAAQNLVDHARHSSDIIVGIGYSRRKSVSDSQLWRRWGQILLLFLCRP